MWRHFSFGKYALCARHPGSIFWVGAYQQASEAVPKPVARGGRSFSMWALIFLELKWEVIDNF